MHVKYRKNYTYYNATSAGDMDISQHHGREKKSVQLVEGITPSGDAPAPTLSA